MSPSRRNAIAAGLALVLVLAGAAAVLAAPRTASTTPPGTPAAGAAKPLAHMVFFTLKDPTRENIDAMVASCHKYLSGHEGALHFSVGVIAEDVVEPVSVRDFHVALHFVFDSKESELKYIEHPRHKTFVEENLPKFEKVRVFDSYLVEP